MRHIQPFILIINFDLKSLIARTIFNNEKCHHRDKSVTKIRGEDTKNRLKIDLLIYQKAHKRREKIKTNQSLCGIYINWYLKSPE